MSLGLHDSRRRRRRSLRWKVVKAVFLLGLLLAAGLLAYETGLMLAQRPVARLERQVTDLTQSLEALRDQNAALDAAAEAARARESEWRQRYEQEVPTGSTRELLDLLRDRLASGVEARRLALVIEGTSNLLRCAAEPVTKRFLVKTPLYQGANDAVSFGNSRITVTAEGQTAVDETGNREAWFDPAQPVTVRFTEIGGRNWQRSGQLPLHHSLVIGSDEFHFSVLEGARGFAKVSAQRCPLGTNAAAVD